MEGGRKEETERSFAPTAVFKSRRLCTNIIYTQYNSFISVSCGFTANAAHVVHLIGLTFKTTCGHAKLKIVREFTKSQLYQTVIDSHDPLELLVF